MRGFALSTLVLSLAVMPALADDGVYRCMAERIEHWAGERIGDIETLPPGEYEIALEMTEATETDEAFAEMVATAERFAIEEQPGPPRQMLATREDGRFTLRIDLDATPMRFAGIGENSLLTGTCFFEPRTTK